MRRYHVGWAEIGLYLGYPTCCILAFERMEHWEEPNQLGSLARWSAFDGTGYVPCKECKKKSKRTLLAEIKKNRRCRTPFPKASGREVVMRAQRWWNSRMKAMSAGEKHAVRK